MILRLQSSIEIHENPDGETVLNSFFLKKRLGFSSKSPGIIQLVKDLQKGVNIKKDISFLSLKYNLKSDVINSIISKLKDNDLLVENDSIETPKDTLYDRQERFFRSFESQEVSGAVLHQNLQQSTVVIVGLGGYGSWSALLCARMGIKNIIGIDFDRVEITNLHRQVLYDRSDIGKFKVEACRERLLECDQDVNFEGYNLKIKESKDLHAIFESADLILNPFSYLPREKTDYHPSGIISRAAIEVTKPCLVYGGSWVGPLTVPGKTPCYFCAIRKLSMTSVLDPDKRSPFIQKRAFAPPIAACASLAVFEASRFLSGCDEAQTLSGIMQLNILSFANNCFLKLNIDRGCEFCSMS